MTNSVTRLFQPTVQVVRQSAISLDTNTTQRIAFDVRSASDKTAQTEEESRRDHVVRVVQVESNRDSHRHHFRNFSLISLFLEPLLAGFF